MDLDSDAGRQLADQSLAPQSGQDLADVELRLEVEAIAQQVESISQSRELADRLQRTFRELRGSMNRQNELIEALQRELRGTLLDVELLKRAATATGQVGVLARSRIERELVREVFPPSAGRNALGVRVADQTHAPKRVDCENRLHLCKAACCRIFTVELTRSEVESDKYRWDAKTPYVLERNSKGCAHLREGTCECSIHAARPSICVNYSCEKDARIWKDFENKVLNPQLAERLKTLDVRVAPSYAASSAPASNGASNGDPATATPAVAAGQQDAPSAAHDEPPAAATPRVAPPDFSELRERLQALPTKVFQPPPKPRPAANEAAKNEAEATH